MENIEIGIIDDFPNERIGFQNTIYQTFSNNHSLKYVANNIALTHGELIYLTIRKYIGNEITIHNCNIFDDSKTCCYRYLNNAFSYICNNEKIKILILCFVGTNEKGYNYFTEILNELYELGKIVIVSAPNRRQTNHPNNLKNLITVNAGAFIKNPDYILLSNNNNKTQIIGDSTPEFVYSPIDDDFHLFSGTSKATPRFCKHVVNGFLDGIVTYSDMIESLYSGSATEKENILENILLKKEVERPNDNDILLEVIKLVNQFFNENKISCHIQNNGNIYIDDIITEIKDYEKLIRFCFKELQSVSYVGELRFCDIHSTYGLANFLIEQVKI